MNCQDTKKILAVTLSCFLVASASSPILYGYPVSTATPSPESGNPTDAAPMSTSELQALVAPIALYPDSLVAQVLTGATFPDQVAIADYWLKQNKNLTGNALMQAVNKQSWDPSVKALTEFPSVLDSMAKNLTWTSSLGEAYHNQKSEVMAAVQTLRAQAKANGTLKSTSQMTVVEKSPQVIVIQPTNPQVVYVPEYNPAVVYGTPYVTPGYTAGDMAAAGIIGFGAGIAVGSLMGGGCCGWGFSSWNCGWYGGGALYHGGAYYGNPAWHGGYYGAGYHGYGYNSAYNRVGNNFRGGSNSYRNVSGNTFNVNRNAAGSFDSDRSSNSWAHQDSWAGKSTAFSGFGDHSGGFGNSGGWASRANSNRGWGSMRSSGFFGGGGFHGFGGGGFHGGFRR